MPYLLNMSSRETVFVKEAPGDTKDWVKTKFDVKRLLNDQHPHALDWEYVTIQGFVHTKFNCIIFPDRGSAFDVEYYTRGA